MQRTTPGERRVSSLPYRADVYHLQPSTNCEKLSEYLNNMVEQDHRAVKRITRPMLGFKSCEAAQGTLAGAELMHMIKKRQLMVEAGDEGLTAAE